MKKLLYFFILLFFFINCKKYSLKFHEFNGVNYCFIDIPKNGLVYIDKIKNFSDIEILKFCYCLAQVNNINYVSIESKFYYLDGWPDNVKRGKTLYKIRRNRQNSG